MNRDRRRGTWMVLAAAAFLLAASVAVDPSRARRGAPLDGEAAAVLAAVSLARDGDLRYDREDLSEATAIFGLVPDRVPLARDTDGVIRHPATGADPWLVSWLVPWLGGRAFAFVHALALSAAVAAVWWRLGARTSRAAAWVLTSVAVSALTLWTFRFTGEALEAALALAGLALVVPGPSAEVEDEWTTPAGRARRALRGVVGGALLGLAAWSAPLPGLVLLAAPILALPQTMGVQRRRLVVLAGVATCAVAMATFALLHLAPFARLRALDPLRPAATVRVFTDRLPTDQGAHFDDAGAPPPSHEVPPGERPSHTLLAVRDALVGRFSGVAWWYPVTAIAVVAVLARRPKPWRLKMLGLAVVGLAALVAIRPTSYARWSDGAGIAGAAVLYPLVVVASYGCLGTRSLVAAWALAGLLLGEPLTNPLGVVRSPDLHVRAWPYTWFPVDVSRAGSLPIDKPLAIGGSELRLQDLLGNVEAIDASCEWVKPTGEPADGCFWTPGERPASMLVWSTQPFDTMPVHLRSGPRRTRVSVAIGSQLEQVKLPPNHVATLVLHDLGPGTHVRENGGDWWVAVLRVRSSHAFQPTLERVGRDRRWLGVQVGLGGPAAPGRGSLAFATD